MKKVIGLCVVLLLSSFTLFAQNNDKRTRRGGDRFKPFERLAEDLKLDEKQKENFQKLNEQYRDKVKVERDAIKAERENRRQRMLAIHQQKKEEIKKLLNEEQYQQYLEKQKPGQRKKYPGMKNDKSKGDRKYKGDWSPRRNRMHKG